MGPQKAKMTLKIIANKSSNLSIFVLSFALNGEILIIEAYGHPAEFINFEISGRNFLFTWSLKKQECHSKKSLVVNLPANSEIRIHKKPWKKNSELEVSKAKPELVR